MYAVVKENRSANKFFMKTRRVPQISSKHDSFDNTIKKDAETLQANQYSNALMKNLMKKRCQNQISSQHEEMARYISTSWICIKQELEQQSNDSANNASNSSSSSSNKSSGGIHYLNSSSTPKNFVPFDLESFWRDRILQNLIGSV